jgi:hypothetical protein
MTRFLSFFHSILEAGQTWTQSLTAELLHLSWDALLPKHIDAATVAFCFGFIYS